MTSGENSIREPDRASKAAWRSIVEKCQQPSVPRALWQIVNTLVPYALLWFLIYRTLAVSWWLAMPLAILAGGFLVRVFIIFHDCGHGSFFKSRRPTTSSGFIAGDPDLYALLPLALGTRDPPRQASGDLDKRGTGDVWTMTVQEYLEASRWKRFAYRLARNPVVLFVAAPLYRFRDSAAIPVRQRRSTRRTPCG